MRGREGDLLLGWFQRLGPRDPICFPGPLHRDELEADGDFDEFGVLSWTGSEKEALFSPSFNDWVPRRKWDDPEVDDFLKRELLCHFPRHSLDLQIRQIYQEVCRPKSETYPWV